jgi:hypothetical protein
LFSSCWQFLYTIAHLFICSFFRCLSVIASLVIDKQLNKLLAGYYCYYNSRIHCYYYNYYYYFIISIATFFFPLALQPQFVPSPTSMKLSVSLRFSRSYIFDRTPWAGDQLVARPLQKNAHIHTNTKHPCPEWDSNP